MSKESREQLASLSFAEKLKLLEKLRYRNIILGGAGLRRPANVEAAKKESRQDWSVDLPKT